MEKHYLFSSNTGNGFVNYFEHVNDITVNGFVFVLKGGPGTGKSHLMRTVAECFLREYFDIEYFHCSADPDSIDAVRLPRHNITIVDGTAPHITEARMPGVHDTYINLARYVGDGIRNKTNTINDYVIEKKRNYELACNYIRAASEIDAANKRIMTIGTPPAASHARTIIKELHLESRKIKATERKFFLTAVSGAGRTDFIRENNFDQITILPCDRYIGRLTLAHIAEILISKGVSVISFYEPLSPMEREAVYIPERNTLIRTGREIITDKKQVTYYDLLKENEESITALLAGACDMLGRSKAAHKQIEKLYFPHMDWKGIDSLTEEIIESVCAIV